MKALIARRRTANEATSSLFGMLLMIAVALASTVVGTAATTPEPPSIGIVSAAMGQLMERELSETDIGKHLHQCAGAPIFMKPSMSLEFAKAAIVNTQRGSDQQLSREARARAKLLATQCLQALSATTAITMPDGVEKADAYCIVIAQAYARGVREALKSRGPEPTEGQLRAAYLGAIREGEEVNKDFVADAQRFEKFLFAFQPLGKNITKLKELTGIRGEHSTENPARVDFKFIGPLGGVVFEIWTSGESIEAVFMR